MRTKLGIVGPKDSVNRFIKIAKPLKSKLIIFPFTYKAVTDTEQIVKNHDSEVDVWVFSGQAPFSIAMNTGITHKAFFPSLNGSSLMKTLFDIAYHHQLMLEHISMDTLTEKEVHETFTDLELPTDHLHLFSYSGYQSTKELVDFHTRLFNKNKTNIAITCVHAVYKQLQSMKIPVYRLTPTNIVLREVINKAHRQSETLYFKNSQIVNIIVQTGGLEQMIEVTRNYRLNLKIQELIIDFTEAISGSYIQLNNEKYMVFSTRGPLETYGKKASTQLLEKIHLLTDLISAMGIGCGKTSMEAEKNAYTSFHQAQHYEENCAMLLDETGEMEVPFNVLNDSIHNEKSLDKELEEDLIKAGVPSSTFYKILHVQNNFSNQAVTASDIAEWLQMTQRNARRVLTNLEIQGLAKTLDQELPVNRGRPRKHYHVYKT